MCAIFKKIAYQNIIVPVRLLCTSFISFEEGKKNRIKIHDSKTKVHGYIMIRIKYKCTY